MSSRLVEVPLALELSFPNGSCCHDLSDLPCQAVARALAEAHLALTNTGGGIKSRKTSNNFAVASRRFVRWLGERGFQGGLDRLDGDTLAEYLETTQTTAQSILLKLLLRRTAEERPGLMADEVLAHLDADRRGRVKSKPLPPYSAGETARLVSACKQAIAAVESRLAEGQELLTQGREPKTVADCALDANILWLLDKHGPRSREDLAELQGWPRYRFRERRRTGHRPWRELCRLFWPTAEDLVPYLVLFGLQSGISPEGVISIRADGMSAISQGRVRIQWYKARGGGLEADTFSSKSPWSPGGLLERVLALTEPARRQASPQAAEALWVALAHAKVRGTEIEIRPVSDSTLSYALAQFSATAQLRDDQDQPLALDRRRLRKTFYARLDRKYHGAVNVVAGVNQSAQVAADHYLAATTESEQISQAIEETQRLLASRAEATRWVTVIADVPALLDDPDAAGTLGLAADKAASLLTTTEADVFAAKCLDFHNSPFAAPGEPCPAAVWECLFCPLAVVTPTKLPNLLRLLDHIDLQAERMVVADWQRRYLAARRAITEQILPRFAPEVVAAARQEAAVVYLPPEEQIA